jgi:hypothetical protein
MNWPRYSPVNTRLKKVLTGLRLPGKSSPIKSAGKNKSSCINLRLGYRKGSDNRLMEITPSADCHLRSFLVCHIAGMKCWRQSAAISSAIIALQTFSASVQKDGPFARSPPARHTYYSLSIIGSGFNG